jgi:hypothetical protein
VPTQPPLQWVPEALFLGVKRPWREADHSPPSSAEVKNERRNTFTSPMRLHDVVLSYSTGTILPLHFYLLVEDKHTHTHVMMKPSLSLP